MRLAGKVVARGSHSEQHGEFVDLLPRVVRHVPHEATSTIGLPPLEGRNVRVRGGEVRLELRQLRDVGGASVLHSQ